MATVAFCGLGRMGEPMARRLIDADHELVVWNRTPERAEGLVDAGARRADTAAEAVEGADAVVTMLATPDALEQVVFGDGGVAAGVSEGTTLIEMSTVGSDFVRDMAARLPDGVGVLDAPVLGSVPQATDGSLEIFVGGPDDLVERWRPLLELMGRPVHFGPLGSGAAMKLVANSTLGALMSALGEALALADSLGLDQALVLDALSESPIGATTRSKRDKVESGEFPPNFTLSLSAKDLRLVTEAAARAGLDVKVAAAAQAHYDAAEAAGLGDLDYSAVIAHIRGKEASGGS